MDLYLSQNTGSEIYSEDTGVTELKYVKKVIIYFQ